MRPEKLKGASFPKGSRWKPLTGFILVLALAAGGMLLWQARRPKAPEPPAVERFTQLLVLSSEQAEYEDIALINMLCAESLPGAEGLQPLEHLRELDKWAQRVRDETQRHFYRFQQAPSEFENSEAYFRMLIMAVVLYEDFSVRYNPSLISTPGETADAGFFANSQDLFLHGLCGVRRMGTCSSMPVLYAAIGRRLGYPLKLATTKSHLFLRWEDHRERFNLEATGRGMNRYDDEHFKKWPYPLSEAEIAADGYLRSLTPPEELALFLSLRGHCLKQAGRAAEAIEAYTAACQFAPQSRPYRLLLAEAQGYLGSPVPPPGIGYVAPSGPPGATAQYGPDPNPRLSSR